MAGLLASLSYAASPMCGPHAAGSHCEGPSKAGSTQRPSPPLPQEVSPEPYPVGWKMGPFPNYCPLCQRGHRSRLKGTRRYPFIFVKLVMMHQRRPSVTWRGAPSLSSTHTLSDSPQSFSICTWRPIVSILGCFFAYIVLNARDCLGSPLGRVLPEWESLQFSVLSANTICFSVPLAPSLTHPELPIASWAPVAPCRFLIMALFPWTVRVCCVICLS